MHDNRLTFDSRASAYDEARPGYPSSLFDDVTRIAHLGPRSRILEIGCGTGQATTPLAQRGFEIDCVEIGSRLAAMAAYNLREYPNVRIHVHEFETWPAPGGAFDLVCSGTAFHWLNPEIAYAKCAGLLHEYGWIALFWNEHSRDVEDIFEREVQEVYRAHAPELADESRPAPGTGNGLPDYGAAIMASGRFRDLELHEYRWEAAYPTRQYLRLLSTYSNHIALESERRSRLHHAIGQLIDTRFHGSIVKAYTSRLYMARKA